MARLFVLFLSVLALSLVQADTRLHADVPEECPPEADLVELSNVKDTQRLCHRDFELASSVIALQCDWVNFRFNFQLNSTGISNDRRIQFFSENARDAKAVAQCPTVWTEAHYVENSYGFLEQGDGQVKTVRIDQGKLYYETVVFVTEELVDNEIGCDGFAVARSTKVRLSCCADPIVPEPKPIVPPFIEECPIDGCKGSPNFDLTCSEIDNVVVIKVTSNHMLNNDIGHQLVELNASPGGKINEASLNLLPGRVDNGVELSGCSATKTVGNKDVNEYEMPAWEFVTHKDEVLQLRSKVEYCAKNAGAPVSSATGSAMPPCRACQAKA